MYDELVTKVNSIKASCTSGLVSKTRYYYDKKNLGKKIEDFNKKIHNTKGLFKKTDYNTKITDIKKKIPSVTGLVTTAVLNTRTTETGSEIPGIKNLPTNVALNIKVTEIGKEVLDTSHFINVHEFDRSTKIIFDVKIKRAVKSVVSKI